MYMRSLLKSIEGAIGPVVKIDRNTNTKSRGQFVRLAVYIDLGKLLISKLQIDGRMQRVEYESMSTGKDDTFVAPTDISIFRMMLITFLFVLSVGATIGNLDKDTLNQGGVATDSSIKNNIARDGGKGDRFRPWMLVERKPRRKPMTTAKEITSNPIGKIFRQRPTAELRGLNVDIGQVLRSLPEGECSTLLISRAIDDLIKGLCQEAPFLCTAVYGSPQKNTREYLWGELDTVGVNVVEPCTMARNFNAILRCDERQCEPVSHNAGCSQFSSFVFRLGLNDLGFQGLMFTWNMGNLFHRLDRSLCNA
ncbi:hypothetical protein GOBAR_DD01665 [Gossypium barbadense]|nr:hypothetical protein GOBAR_DD01665 [Gossypium barbadense]